MNLQTRHFGEITVSDDTIITFDSGLPGFDTMTKFTLLTNSENPAFCWLQSIDDGDLAFVLFDVGSIMKEYDPKIDVNSVSELGKIENNLLIYNIVVVPENAEEMTVNLKAPIVINTDTKKGKQVIVNNDDYQIKHYIFKD